MGLLGSHSSCLLVIYHFLSLFSNCTYQEQVVKVSDRQLTDVLPASKRKTPDSPFSSHTSTAHFFTFAVNFVSISGTPEILKKQIKHFVAHPSALSVSSILRVCLIYSQNYPLTSTPTQQYFHYRDSSCFFDCYYHLIGIWLESV